MVKGRCRRALTRLTQKESYADVNKLYEYDQTSQPHGSHREIQVGYIMNDLNATLTNLIHSVPTTC
jgi:hypothetical protein